MGNTRISQVSFSRGELCPPLHQRTDIKHRAIGLKTLKNGFVNQEGCVSNRFGLEYVGEVKDSTKDTRLIPFTFNSEQTYIIEAGDKYFRFIQNGGYIVYPDTYGVIYEGAYTYVGTGTNTDSETYYEYKIDNVSYYSSETIAQNVILYTDKLFETQYGVVENVDTDEATLTVADSDKKSKRGDIVEISTPYKAADLRNIKYVQSADVLTLTHMDYTPRELSRYDHHIWSLDEIIIEASIDAPTNVTVTWTGSTSSNTRQYTYLVTAVDEKTLEESARSQEVTATGHREAHWETSEYFTISWTAVEGATEYNIYRSVNGVFGYSGTSTTTSFVDDNIEPDLSETAPIQKNPFANNNNPSCCAYYQQRKIYGNTLNNPQTLYASQTATSNNFNASRPLVASDAIEIPLADRDFNEIRHLVPMKDLIALTSNSEYKINGSDGIFQANPMPVAVIQSCYGASNVQPIISGTMVLFVQSGGNVLRDLGYDYLSDTYDGDELSLMASHLFEGKEIIYIAYAREPYRLVFVVFNDGSLATLTYNKKQEICGWGRQETQGKFKSVAVVREGQEDIAYFIIERIINNQTVKYIERTKSRVIKDAKKGFLVDCGVYAHFDTPVTSVSGLNHLINTDVIALADGGVIQGLTVSSNGTLTLPNKTSDLVVGLPYEFEFETLGVEGENTHGLKKQINTVTVNILNSREDFFVLGNDGHETQLARSIESINDSGYLYSGKKDATPLNTPTDVATVHIKQKYPLPLTISAVSSIVNIEDISER